MENEMEKDDRPELILDADEKGADEKDERIDAEIFLEFKIILAQAEINMREEFLALLRKYPARFAPREKDFDAERAAITNGGVNWDIPRDLEK